jgi:Zn-dependent hydrolases, including glyoxylases
MMMSLAMNIESKTYKVGDVEVTRISESIIDNLTHVSLFPDWNLLTDQQKKASLYSMEAKPALLSTHTWLVKTRKHIILVDTAAGNDKERSFTPYFDHLHLPYLEKLSKAGIKPEDVDYVLMTHLHVDHVGWNTRLSNGEWIPTFPNAKYVFSKGEYEYYKDPVNHNDRNKTSVIVQKDSVLPIIEAGLAEMICIEGTEFIDGLSFKPTPGHSINHSSIILSSRGENALFSGDIFHNPIQVCYPELNSIFDAFADQARSSRLWGVEYAADHHATVFSSHFPESSAGLVARSGEGFEWQYI